MADVTAMTSDDQSGEHVETAALLRSATSKIEQVPINQQTYWSLEEETGFDCE